MKEWARMPSYWIREEDVLLLRTMRWVDPDKANQIAGLMLYMVLVHHASTEPTIDKPEAGLCSLTYSELSEITGLSRAKVAGGLSVLINLNIISQIGTGRNNIYKIAKFDAKSGWAKLPAKGLYSRDLKSIPAFQRFHLRSKNELNALKLYLLVVALRNDKTNYAQVGYERINHYTGIHRNEIKSAASLLINLGLIQVDSGSSEINDHATSNMYRLCYLETYKHRGTTTRGINLVGM